jgi:hypothetical protein
MKLFEIRRDTSLGALVGRVKASHVFEAAVIAAQTYFKRPAAFRISGWGGAGGTFQAAERLDAETTPMRGATFYVKEVRSGHAK